MDLIDRNSLIDNLQKFAPEHFNVIVNDLIMKEPTACDIDKIIEKIKTAGTENGEVIIDYAGTEMISKQRVIDIIHSGKKEGEADA